MTTASNPVPIRWFVDERMLAIGKALAAVRPDVVYPGSGTSVRHRVGRHRRTLRHDLHIAQQQLERAEDYLERTRQRTTPAVERNNQAMAAQRDAREQLLNCDTLDRLDAMLPTVGEHQLHVRALNAWQHGAHGHDIPDRTLRTVFAVLAHRPGPEQQLAVALQDDPARPGHRARVTRSDDGVAVQAVPHDLGIEM